MKYLLYILVLFSVSVQAQTIDVNNCPESGTQSYLIDESFGSGGQTFRVGKDCGTVIDSFCTQYDTVLAHMIVKPSVADKVIQNEMLKALVDSGYYAKAELIDIFAVSNSADASINWKSPGHHDPIPTGSPTWTQYQGYKGSSTGTKYVKLNFIPKTDSTVMSRLSFTTMVGIGTDSNETVAAQARDFGVYDGTQSLLFWSRLNNNMDFIGNSTETPSATSNTNSIGHYIISRNSSTTIRRGHSMYPSSVANNASASLVTKQLYVAGRNNNGTPEPNNKEIRYTAIFSYLQPYQEKDVTRIFEKYLDNYSKGLLSGKWAFSYTTTRRNSNLVTYVENNNETIHPSVINAGEYISGYKYWMANTPYPTKLGTQLDNENPSIWASNDGKTWEVPVGLTNPIVPKPPSGFNADPDICYDGDSLRVFYKTPLSSTGLAYKASKNGVNWSQEFKVEILLDSLVSPSYIKIGNTHYIYYVNSNAGSRAIERQSATNIRGPYSNREVISFSQSIASKWHMDIQLINGTYWIFFVTDGGTGGIYYAYSSNGTSFTLPGYLFLPSEIPAAALYRPTVMQTSDNTIWLYYPEQSASGWFTYQIKLGIIE